MFNKKEVILIAVPFVFSSTVIAEESVCANQSGAAFGLCNAYYEAMDCDSAEPLALGTACARVAENFQKITGMNILYAPNYECLGDPDCPPGYICIVIEPEDSGSLEIDEDGFIEEPRSYCALDGPGEGFQT